MFLYYALAVIACIVAGVIIAVRSRKAEGVSYGVLDKVGIVTNILLIPAYIVVSFFCLFLVMLGMNPDGEGFMLVVIVLVSAITYTSSAIWGLGLGASVALRRKGIIDALENAGCGEGDPVRMYELEFDYTE